MHCRFHSSSACAPTAIQAYTESVIAPAMINNDKIIVMVALSYVFFYCFFAYYALSRRIGSPFPKLMALLQFTCGFEQRCAPNPYAT